jgi:hypothetical protein
MSCDNSTYLTAVVDLHLLSPVVETGDYAKAKETDLQADKSLKQRSPRLNADESRGCRREVSPRIVPDRTQTDPEYVWGDEGRIND